MGLGQAHGAGPLAGREFAQVGLFLRLGAVGVNRRHRTVGQARVHAPGSVAGTDHLADHQPQGTRQPLPAIRRIRRQPMPATLDVLGERLLEALGGGDHAIVEMAAFFVAAAVQRGQDVFAEAGALFEDRIDHVRTGIGGPERGVIGMEVKHVVDQKAHVAQGGFVLRHGHCSVSRSL